MKKVAIIGAGPAGIEAASVLARAGVPVTVFEKSSDSLSNLRDKSFLFPNFQPSPELVDEFSGKLQADNITVRHGSCITELKWKGTSWELVCNGSQNLVFDAVLIATGYRTFDASRKEELGYGIYKGVITSLEMEQMIKSGSIPNANGDIPQRIAFLQCVGSRDEKSGNNYCSKVCCVTAVKQAIEVRKILPKTELTIFYMDLRMWGQGFEEMYRTAQEKYGIDFIRGRISEAASTFDGRIQIKTEDTLLGLPMKASVDLLVLMVGMEASDGTRTVGRSCDICGEYGFIRTLNPHLYDNETDRPGLFAAGSCKRPMSINDSVNDGRSAATVIREYLDQLSEN
ncbi:MAG: FAD-dependent oxidoreductase [Bacteroidaceae bacterium]|nr:FAD-dependent oxidoreductase [Bacteroidaceae bacterium]